MSSRKPSANKKRVKEFKSQLSDFDDLFERESHREQKACASKNRYSSESEALVVIEECAEHGTTGLHAYRCRYCDGWHITSHPWDADGDVDSW